MSCVNNQNKKIRESAKRENLLALYFPRKNRTAPDTRTFLLNRLGSRQSGKMENFLALYFPRKNIEEI